MKRSRAMVLLEVMIAIALGALMVAIAVPSFNALTSARMKESSSILVGVIRDTYARTALSGRTSRLVIDFEQRAYWIEEGDGPVRIKSNQAPDRDGNTKLDTPDERIERIDANTEDVVEQTKLAILSPPPFKRIDGDDGLPHPLPPGVRWKSFWAEHLEEPARAGQAALYFYSGGLTEEALITLTDDDDGRSIMQLAVNGLSGETTIDNEEKQPPRLDEDPL